MVALCFIKYVVLVSVLGGDFQKYMEAFKPFLAIGLKNFAEYQVGHLTTRHPHTS